jgi:hypothetical protein
MPEPMDAQHFAGPHPTCREFVAQLTAWGFAQRGEDQVHKVFRGPHGGTLRVIRSQLGRADPTLVDKAARLVGVTPAQFWAGPQPQAGSPPPQDTAPAGRASRRKRAAHDSVISVVLAIHAEADRPLGFDQVVELSGNRMTRDQVSSASSALCRDGQLDRIRSGVYQWSAGLRAARRIPAVRRAGEALPPQPRPSPDPAGGSARQPGPMSAAELFSQLFPSGVQMTGELLADLEQWARLTGKLASNNGDTAPSG